MGGECETSEDPDHHQRGAKRPPISLLALPIPFAVAALPPLSGQEARAPGECPGAPAINDSRVWLLYDDQALYIGDINHDEDPSSTATNMARRDAGYAGRSDYFEIMIDPNNDGLTGYRLRVTAGGVQTDRYLFNDGGEDSTWDAVHEHPVTIDERGWIVEMRIPLAHFPSPHPPPSLPRRLCPQRSAEVAGHGPGPRG